ncbi:MAG: hydrogenase expression/formation protein HypE [bacterium]|nr:hydrogenase expression/formation protein HypE [bacterium]
MNRRVISMAHGGGGLQMHAFLRRVVWSQLDNPYLREESDAAVLEVPPGMEAVFTTDSFVVQPLFFPGGDIGHLAVCGTINDLAMMGAEPAALSLALILEEGIEEALVEKVITSVRATAEAAGVPVVTGDTKVVERGHADQMYVTSSGVGWRRPGVVGGWRSVRPGDAVIVSGTIGHHGVAVLAARAELPFITELRSDAAPLHRLVKAALAACPAIRWMRDPTRGGVAAALNELAAQTGLSIELNEGAIPVAEDVRGAAEILGLDPLYLANEGRVLFVCAKEWAGRLVAALRAEPEGRGAVQIGQVGEAVAGGRVTVRTGWGGVRLVDMPSGEQLPRIC